MQKKYKSKKDKLSYAWWHPMPKVTPTGKKMQKKDPLKTTTNSWWKSTASANQRALGIDQLRKIFADALNNNVHPPDYMVVSEDRYMEIQEDTKQTFMIQQLRRISYKWPPRTEAKKRAWVSRGYYRCASCKEVFHYKKMQLDHIIPVIDPVKGWIGYDDFINRLFCDSSGFQYLCKSDHQEKTKKENKIRHASR